jgi:hypothetical protein
MRKKLLILAPMFAVLAFMVATAVAEASPHYYVNNVKLAAGKKTDVVGWGTITLTTNAAPVGNALTCHNIAGGTITGTLEGTNGKGSTEQFAVYNCTQKKQCPKETDTAAVVGVEAAAPTKSSLPWPSELREEGGGIRSATTEVEVIVNCIVTEGEGKGTTDQSVPFISNNIPGSKCEAQAPKTVNGVSAVSPGFVEFGDEFTKELEIPSPPGSCSLIGKTEGEVKALGYKGQELVNTKNP